MLPTWASLIPWMAAIFRQLRPVVWRPLLALPGQRALKVFYRPLKTFQIVPEHAQCYVTAMAQKSPDFSCIVIMVYGKIALGETSGFSRLTDCTTSTL
jgi:hypothetical protein